MTSSGSGGPIQVSGPAVDGALEIRGGIGGITFQFEELIGGAEKLDDLASELAAVEAEVSRIQGCLRLSQALSQAQAFGTDAEISLGEAQRSVQAVRADLQGISGQVRASKNDYELAELAAGVARRLGIPSVKDFLYSCTDQQITGLPNRNAMELLTGNVALSLSALLGLSRAHLAVALAADMAAGRHISAVGPLIRSLADGSRPELKPRSLTVEQRESVPIQLDASLAGLLDRARIVDERGDGYVEVIEVDSAGQKAYVVVIPGTQAGAQTGGDNPFDIAGIAEGLGYGSAEVSAGVLQSLQAAGAPEGSPVVAVGYSQGGVHAMNLAADELFQSKYDMKYVLTAGSPVGGIIPDEGVSSLHLEHREDWVPGSDGTPGPDARNRVTVTLNKPVWTPAGEDPGLGPGHKLSNYQEGARLVAASDEPSLMASTAVLSGVLGAGGTATATRFALTRSKPPETAIGRGPVPTPMAQVPPQPPQSTAQQSSPQPVRDNSPGPSPQPTQR